MYNKLKYPYINIYIHKYIRWFIHTGAFYFTLGNCSPKLRSKMQSIQLVALVKKRVLDQYGITAVLRPMVDDLKKLVSGLKPIYHSRLHENAHH